MGDSVGKKYRVLVSLAALWSVIMPAFGQQVSGPVGDIWDLTVVEQAPSEIEAGESTDNERREEQNRDENSGNGRDNSRDNSRVNKGSDEGKDIAPSLVDRGHGYFTQRTNELTRWADNYFGGTEVDQETASSRLRLRFITDWDERYGTDFRVRVGGKVNLPAISKKLDLVFRGDDSQDDINGQEDPAQSRVGLQYQLSRLESKRHRFDLTLGVNSSGPRPGVKYRYHNQLSDKDTLRVTQRIQYDRDEGAHATTRVDVDHALNENQLLRSYSRIFYSGESDGVEWSTSGSHILRWRDDTAKPGLQGRAAMVFAEVSGVTEPWSYVSNYRVGVRYRQQAYRNYLFIELEPSYNWRIDEPGLSREGAWRVELRFEFLLFDDLRHDKKTKGGG